MNQKNTEVYHFDQLKCRTQHLYTLNSITLQN
jgi:hypothetical protein